MTSEPPPIIPYASRGASAPKPTMHSALAGWSWAALIFEVAFRGGVVAYAYHCSPTWPWERFYRNVGNIDTFIEIDFAFLWAGTLLAILALVRPHRKRWAALLALAAHLFSILVIHDFLTINRR